MYVIVHNYTHAVILNVSFYKLHSPINSKMRIALRAVVGHIFTQAHKKRAETETKPK